MNIQNTAFGTANGQQVSLFTLTNNRGMTVEITNYGGIVVSIIVPDRFGKAGDVVVGYDNLKDFLANAPYFGALCGRFANRIAVGQFKLGGKTYKLALNNGTNALHGGLKGFDKVVWDAKEFSSPDGVGVELTYLSKDGEEGYPGNLTITVVYTLTDSNELALDYWATTDKDTVLNPTNHTYFNLAGAGDSDILGHEVTLNASKFVPVNANLIPTGKLAEVKGTPLDFTSPHTIGERIGKDDEQLKFAGGYDHCWVLDKKSETELCLAASVYEPTTGRTMEVLTTEPGIQLYTGNFLDGHNIGKGGKAYQKRSAFCLETEHFPDSPNWPQFPSTVLEPGQTFRSRTIYKFASR